MTPMLFNIPQLPEVLARPRLHDLLEAHRHCRIILVTGQAAQGKSTMAATYLTRDPAPCLWFHLTSATSDSGALFDLLARGIEPLAGSSADNPSFPHVSLGTRQDLPRQAESLVRAMNRIRKPVNIVLDDVEVLSPQSSSLGLIQALLTGSPQSVRFFLLSRTLPELNLSRFKMRQELLELNNEDLAFTLDEAMAFFRETVFSGSGELDRESVEKVLAVTNGWAGGLVLVSESVRRARGLEGLPEHLSSEVFSYFSQEICRDLPPEIQGFLKRTALFDELDTRILSLLFTDMDPRSMLDQLEARNLFIQKIIPKKPWPVFKYNNLFREFLLADLNEEMAEGELAALNERIGQIYWEEKDPEKALPFFLAAGAYGMAARILRIKGADYVITGRTDRLSRWIDALPEEITGDDAWLIFFRTMARRIRGGKKNIKAFTRALEIFREKDDIRGILLSLAYLIEASVFVRQPSGEILKQILAGEKALADLGGQYRFTWARTLLWQQIGLGYIAGTGEIPKGISACRNAVLLAQNLENQALVLNGSVILALGLVQSGDFSRAREMLAKTRAVSQEDSQPEYRALENITNIDLALKRGNTAMAGDLLTRSEADIETFGLIFLYPGLVEARALYHAGTGQFDQAIQAADHLRDFSILEGNDFYLGISYRIKAMACLLKGDAAAACTQARKAVAELHRSRRGDIHFFLARQVYGAALYHTGQIREACQELEPVLDYFKKINADYSLCETAFLLGLSALESGSKPLGEKAAGYFSQGVEKALENNYRHFLLVPAPLMGEILVRAWRTLAQPETILVPYVRSIDQPELRSSVLEAVTTIMEKEAKKKKGAPETFAPLFRASCHRLMISTLGPFSVIREGEEEPVSGFGGAKPLMLLKQLLLKGGRDVPKETLMDSLWPDAGEAAGEKNLKINLHRLRKALEPFAQKAAGSIYLGQKSGRVSLEPDLVSIDTAAFTALVGQGRAHEDDGDDRSALNCYGKAVALYRGEYFGDDPFLEGVTEDREMYRRICIDTFERMAGMYQAQDRPQEAVETWERLLAVDDCHEPAYRELMTLHAGAGMTKEAAQVFHQCCDALARELDAEPDAQTRALFDRLVRQKGHRVSKP